MVFALVEVACLVVMNPEKASLYFCLAFVGGFLISLTVMCGSWMALKLAPVANDRTSMYSHRSTMTHSRFALNNLPELSFPPGNDQVQHFLRRNNFLQNGRTLQL